MSDGIVLNVKLLHKALRKPPNFKGIGLLSGQITEKGIGEQGIVKILHHPEPNDLIRWSLVAEFETASDGTWEYPNINESFTYDIIYTLNGWQDRTLTKVKPFVQ